MARELDKFILDGNTIEVVDTPARERADEANEKVDNLQGDVEALDSKIDRQGVPVGGTDGQVLTKNGSDNYNARWETPQSGGAEIDDNDISASKVWSSQKTNSEIQSNSINPEDIIEPLQEAGIEVFTSDGTFTVPEGVSTVYVTMYDGGGGGACYSTNGGAGGGANGGAGGTLKGGGGAGGYEIQKPLPVIAGETLDITVGAGGAGGTSGVDGGKGGTSSISREGEIVFVTTKQGANGGKSQSTGGAGGTYGAGGGAGGVSGNNIAGGAGGSLGIGGNGGTGVRYATGGTGGSYGAGGGGSDSSNGGDGAQGIVIITWGFGVSTIENVKILIR